MSGRTPSPLHNFWENGYYLSHQYNMASPSIILIVLTSGVASPHITIRHGEEQGWQFYSFWKGGLANLKLPRVYCVVVVYDQILIKWRLKAISSLKVPISLSITVFHILFDHLFKIITIDISKLTFKITIDILYCF